MHAFTVSTHRRCEFVDITERVQKLVTQAAVAEGLCVVFVPHTTAAVTLNEHADPDVVRDLVADLAARVPHQGDYRHAEGNSDSHIKASLLGNSQTVPISGGRLALGRWQGIFLCEFDGPRTRNVQVQLLAGSE